MEVKVIPPSKSRKEMGVPLKEQQKLRVAAYCRVSTDLEEQESSYDAQVQHYAAYILRNPAWDLAGIYADEGISGTETKSRDEFNRMIDESMSGGIDLIITKSISRFARNTLDCLKYIRMLKDKGVAIFFEKENINTLDAKGEVLITIMAALAQQESQSISQNVKMGIRYQYQQGVVRINHTWFLGYTRDRDGNLVIVPEEAEVVRRIFQEFLDGSSLGKIARGLERDGIRTGAGREKWYESTIRSMLMNEKYMGDALLQKAYTADFLTKKKNKNDGVLPQYYVENDHEPIVSKEMFAQVQDELKRRSAAANNTGGRQRYNSGFMLSGRMICSECGSAYRRVKANGRNIHTTWRCKTRMKKAANCSGRIVTEDEIHEAIWHELSRMHEKKDRLLERLDQIRAEEIEPYAAESKALNERIWALQEEINAQISGSRSVREAEDNARRLRENTLEMEKRKRRQKELAALSKDAAVREGALINLLDYFAGHESAEGAYCPAEVFENEQMMTIVESVTVLPEGFRISFFADAALAGV